MEAALAAVPGSVLGRLHGQGQNAAVVECKVGHVSSSWLHGETQLMSRLVFDPGCSQRTVVDQEGITTALSEQCVTPGNMPTDGSGGAITSGKAFASCDLV